MGDDVSRLLEVAGECSENKHVRAAVGVNVQKMNIRGVVRSHSRAGWRAYVQKMNMRARWVERKRLPPHIRGVHVHNRTIVSDDSVLTRHEAGR